MRAIASRWTSYNDVKQWMTYKLPETSLSLRYNRSDCC